MIPVVIVTGSAEHDNKRNALDGGATDLLSKPVSVDDLVARIRSSLKIKHYEEQLEKQGEWLAEQVVLKTAELSSSRLEIIWRLAKASEYRDEDTGHHVVRVGAYSRIIAEALGHSSDYVAAIFHAAPLHDIGKLGIPDAILLKPGKLSPEEWAIMKTHCQIGVSILEEECNLGRLAVSFAAGGNSATKPNNSNPFLKMAAEIAGSHHEKWNGSGYPHGLVGTQIPLSARIVALSDVYDALRSRRPYKEPMPLDRTLAIISEGRGEHFDPQVVDKFLSCFQRIQDAERSLSDNRNREVSSSSLFTPCDLKSHSTKHQLPIFVN